MISSTSKKLILLAALAAGCSHEEKRILPVTPERPAEIKYSLGPEVPSSTFVDKTKEYGLEGVEAVHLYAVDVNNDGATDLITLSDFYSAPKFFLKNKKENKFEAVQSPFDSVVRGSYMNFVDLDHDGIYDCIVGTLNQKTEVTQYPPRLFKGELTDGKLHYKEVAPLPTSLLPTASVVALDFDQDGKLDLYLANWFSYKGDSPRPVPDLLLKGNGFEFQDNSTALKGEYDYNKTDKVYRNATPTFGASVCDVDRNGFPDILTSNSNGYFDKLWLNFDGKNYVNYAYESSFGGDEEGAPETLGGGNSFFSLCGDYNNDGIVDIVQGNISRDTDPESRDKSSMLTGSTKSFPPKYIRSEFYRDDLKPKWSEGDRRGVWIDYNLDGLNDLLIDNSGFPPDSRLILFEQEKDHAYNDRSKELGINLVNPSGTVTLDLNGDGVMDFITGQSKIRAGDVNNRLYVFENQTKRQDNGSIRFHLRGKSSNTHGLSSSVFFTTNKTTRFFNVEYSGGSLPSQNEEGAYFAFAKEIPQTVTVRWAFATVDRLGRMIPRVLKYNLQKLNLKGKHHEFNLCDDGRLLLSNKSCY